MSFFNRSNPGAPAARRTGAPGGQAQSGGSAAYERLNESYSSHPRQQPPAPQQYGSQGGGGGGYGAPPPPPPRQHAPSHQQPQYDQHGYPQEKAEYRPQPPAQSRYQPDPRAGAGHAGARMFEICNCPDERLALTNRLVVSPSDFAPEVEFVIIRGQYIVSIIRDPTGMVPPGSLGASKMIRKWIGLSAIGDSVDCEPYKPSNGEFASDVSLEIGFLVKSQVVPDVFDAADMAKAFVSAFPDLPVVPGQLLVFDYRGNHLKATVTNVSTLDGKDGAAGIVMEGTEIMWSKDPQSAIKLKNTGNNARQTQILAPNFKFADMGIGGLDAEFSTIFRRAFASRIFPAGLVEKLGIQHVKGILLYGPPGTGKTLIARQIGKMLNAREPKVVNGPEILNKFVGQSEENIRKLFADAEKEQKEKGDESGLHIIIFDELDAITKQRGSQNSGTGVGDSIVNQLLSKMDGVDQLNNVLIIGMTNRMDMIDEALLRPGRLEVHIEISLPDESGRAQILNIHTAKIRDNGVMGPDVDLAELAALTKNFSGAEIGGLVKSATSFAMNRHVKVGSVAQYENVENMKIMREDFMHALDEVQPAYGVSEEELQEVVQNGIIHYSKRVNEILQDGKLLAQQVSKSERTPLVSALLHGPSGAGKTALAATIAMQSDFPFIKLISPEQMVGYSESAKIQHLHKVFADSYKSPYSVIVVDSLERLLEWNPIGPRFSNGILQALVVLFGKRPPKGRRLLILATTSHRSILTEMGVLSAFDTDIPVPPIQGVEEIATVLREVKFGSGEEIDNVVDMLDGRPGLHVGVKKLLTLAEMARQDPSPAQKLATSLVHEIDSNL